MKNIKTKDEIETMKEGGKMLYMILQKLKEEVRPGITTGHLEELARELVSFYGAKSSFFGYDGYPAFLCASVNEEIVHGVPSTRVLADGDILKLDMGILHKGFHTDSALTVIVGEDGDEKKKKLLRVTREALDVGISTAKAGNTIGDIGSAIQKFVRDNGFEVIQDLVGHGIGRELHEWPQVPNFGRPGEGEMLEEGMVIAIEPMVVTGNKRTKVGKDGFVFMTADKGLAAHFEHTVAITEDRARILTII